MIASELNDKIKCAFSDNEHYLVEPTIALHCGHAICKNCLPETSNSSINIECKICGDTSSINLKKVVEFQYVKQLIKANFSLLYESALMNSEKSFKTLSGIAQDVKNRVKSQVVYAKEEIEIRIESIKIELDEISERLMNELDSKMNDLFNVIDAIKIEEYLQELEKLRTKIEESSDESTVFLNELNSKTNDINDLIKDFKNLNYELKFQINEEKFDSNLIGNIDFIFNNRSIFTKTNILNKLKAGKLSSVFTNFRSTDSCLIFDQNYLLTANYRDNCLTLYDKNFNLFKKIDKFNGFKLNPFGVTTNNLDRIYVTDRDNHRIFMFDYKFKILSVIGSRGCNQYQFEYPRGICFSANFLYICDWLNKRIEKYTPGLSYKDSIKLDYNPIQIKTVNNTACVRNEKNSIYFYDLINFKLKSVYKTHNGCIYSIDKYFYEYYHVTNKFYCYNEQGKLVDEIEGYDQEIKINEWASLVYFNSNLILLPEISTNMIVF